MLQSIGIFSKPLFGAGPPFQGKPTNFARDSGQCQSKITARNSTSERAIDCREGGPLRFPSLKQKIPGEYVNGSESFEWVV